MDCAGPRPAIVQWMEQEPDLDSAEVRSPISGWLRIPSPGHARSKLSNSRMRVDWAASERFRKSAPPRQKDGLLDTVLSLAHIGLANLVDFFRLVSRIFSAPLQTVSFRHWPSPERINMSDHQDADQQLWSAQPRHHRAGPSSGRLVRSREESLDFPVRFFWRAPSRRAISRDGLLSRQSSPLRATPATSRASSSERDRTGLELVSGYYSSNIVRLSSRINPRKPG